MLTGENQNIWRKSCHSANLSTTNPTCAKRWVSRVRWRVQQKNVGEGCQLEAGRMWEETDEGFWKNTDEEAQL